MRDREKARQRAKELVAAMTLEEKASQLRYDSPAIPRLGCLLIIGGTKPSTG